MMVLKMVQELIETRTLNFHVGGRVNEAHRAIHLSQLRNDLGQPSLNESVCLVLSADGPAVRFTPPSFLQPSSTCVRC